MSYEIDWHENFYGISWAYEKDRLVVSTVFEDKKEANTIAQEIEEWSDKFTRLTIVEKENGEFSICCYEDPQISKSSEHIGLFRTGMIQSGGYENAKPMIEEKPPLLQIAYAAFEGKQQSFGLKDTIPLPTYEIQTPKQKLLDALNIVYTHDKQKLTKKEMAEIAEQKEIITVNAENENHSQARFASLDKNIIEPLEKQWGFIEVEKVGRNRWISITEEGKNAAEFLI